ncbi:putative non-specific serine/threonine protein kinase [Helianthus annuus]|nr:putative non-specific serine/threonine protein kinase [Helianthus annuus]
MPTNLRVFKVPSSNRLPRTLVFSAKLGEGGFGSVYVGTVKDLRETNKEFKVAGHKEWVAEVNVLGIVQHPNLVK